MAKLSLFWAVKPLWVNQSFGIYNPAYKLFGFTKHNGIDFSVSDGQLAYAMCEGIVTEVGENSGAGKYIKYRTLEPVEAEGRTGVVCFMYMHGKRIIAKKGDMVKAGTVLMECDNTGFSTGHHLHISAFFVDEAGRKIKQGAGDTNWCFDFSKYSNKYFAQDADKVILILQRLVALLTQLLKQ